VYIWIEQALMCTQMACGTGPTCVAGIQVSFFRSNLMLRVVAKPKGHTADGKPADLEALVNYIRCGP
jgi:hypothetical protein